MSVTGRNPEGFTLLEVLGIIVLIGLTWTLVYPNWLNGAEKTHIHYLGKLLISDLQQIRETAVTDRDSIKVVLADHGYYYNLNNHEIRRSFPEYGFSFKISTETTAGETVATLDDRAELVFQPNGDCNELSVNWQSQHLRGSLQVAPDGIASWNYATKKR